MNETIGFVGSGNMDGTMIGRIIKAGLTAEESIYISDISGESLVYVWESYDVNTATDSTQLVKTCDTIVLSVKPFLYPAAINQIKAVVKEGAIIAVIAAGQSPEAVAQLFGRGTEIVKTMPSTPALVGEGMAVIVSAKNVTKKETAEIMAISNSFGKSEIIPRHLMDTVAAVSGSSPVHVYMMVEVMADAAVVGDTSRSQAHKFAAQAALGSVQMVLETGKHPGELKDMVCSPRGTTIAAVVKFKRAGFRSSIMQGIRTCAGKSREIPK